jgi:CheY-like chemotaxis protein
MKKEIITSLKKNSPDIINEWSALVHKSTIHYKDLSLKETKQSVGRHYDAVIEVLDKENYDALNDFPEYLALFFSEKFSVKVLTDTDSISTYLDSAYCLLIDVDFVNKTGFELLKSIKSSLPSIKIVVMYKASQKKHPEHSVYQHYSDASVLKPFDVQDIFNIIARIEHSEIHR